MPEEPQVEDWRAWQAEGAPAPPLWTRARVLAEAERAGVAPPVDERTLRYWEKLGLVPRATEEGKRGKSRALYPSWVVDLLLMVRQYQDAGYRLNQLPPLLRVEARRLSLDRHPRGAAPAPTGGLFASYVRRELAERRRWPAGALFVDPVLGPDAERDRHLAAALAELGELHRLAFGVTITGAELQLIADTGERYTVPLRFPASPDVPPEVGGQQDDTPTAGDMEADGGS